MERPQRAGEWTNDVACKVRRRMAGTGKGLLIHGNAPSGGYCSRVISSDAERLGEEAADRLARTGRYEIGPGLTGAEFARIEQDYGFEFADDHRAFLAAGLPLNFPAGQGYGGQPWPDWRDGDPGVLREWLDEPVEGALFDVEYNALWRPS